MQTDIQRAEEQYYDPDGHENQEPTYEDATHFLKCVHQINNKGNRREYTMPCIILKELPGNRSKILVFGYKTKKVELCDGAKRIRYVSKDRLILAKDLEAKNGL